MVGLLDMCVFLCNCKNALCKWASVWRHWVVVCVWVTKQCPYCNGDYDLLYLFRTLDTAHHFTVIWKQIFSVFHTYSTFFPAHTRTRTYYRHRLQLSVGHGLGRAFLQTTLPSTFTSYMLFIRFSSLWMNPIIRSSYFCRLSQITSLHLPSEKLPLLYFVTPTDPQLLL